MAEESDGNIKRGKYNKAQRELAFREISRLLLDGFTINDISQQTKIPKRSVERYVQQLYRDDNLLLERPTQEQRSTAVNIFLSQVAETNRELLEMARNTDEHSETRIHAYDLRIDLAFSALKLRHNYSPEYVARDSRDIKHNPLVQEQKGLRVTLIKDEKSQLPLRYESASDNGNGASK